jgi:hypothetical protein
VETVNGRYVILTFYMRETNAHGSPSIIQSNPWTKYMLQMRMPTISWLLRLVEQGDGEVVLVKDGSEISIPHTDHLAELEDHHHLLEGHGGLEQRVGWILIAVMTRICSVLVLEVMLA